MGVRGHLAGLRALLLQISQPEFIDRCVLFAVAFLTCLFPSAQISRLLCSTHTRVGRAHIYSPLNNSSTIHGNLRHDRRQLFFVSRRMGVASREVKSIKR